MNNTEPTVIKWKKVVPGFYRAKSGPHYFEAWHVEFRDTGSGRIDHWQVKHTGPTGYADPRYRFNTDEELAPLPTLRECKRQALLMVEQASTKRCL